MTNTPSTTPLSSWITEALERCVPKGNAELDAKDVLWLAHNFHRALRELVEMTRRAEITESIIKDIGDLIGVFSIDGHEYVVGVKALLAGHKMPHYQIVEARAESAERALVEARARVEELEHWLTGAARIIADP